MAMGNNINEQEIYRQLKNDSSIAWVDVQKTEFKKKEKKLNGRYYSVFEKK